MSDVLVAVDGTGAAGPVLRTAVLLAQSLGHPLRAVHAGPWSAATQEQAAGLGISLELLDGPADQAVLAAVTDPDLGLVVMGLHGVPGRHSTGHMVHALAAHVTVPLIVVPPCAPLRQPPTRVLFPLDGSQRVSEAARPVIAGYVAAGIDVVALHVYERSTVPQFHDGPEDELVWRDEFLAEHLADLAVRLTTSPGPLVPALLQAAVTHEADIIALPARRDASARAGSVLHQVLAAADRPVALVPLARVRAVEEQRA